MYLIREIFLLVILAEVALTFFGLWAFVFEEAAEDLAAAVAAHFGIADTSYELAVEVEIVVVAAAAAVGATASVAAFAETAAAPAVGTVQQSHSLQDRRTPEPLQHIL